VAVGLEDGLHWGGEGGDTDPWEAEAIIRRVLAELAPKEESS